MKTIFLTFINNDSTSFYKVKCNQCLYGMFQSSINKKDFKQYVYYLLNRNDDRFIKLPSLLSTVHCKGNYEFYEVKLND